MSEALSIQLKVANMARKALKRPVPARVHSTGKKITETRAMKASNGLRDAAPPFSPSPFSEPRPGRRACISAKSSGTSLPMTTWYWPPVCTTVTTPAMSLMAAESALDSSLRTNRIRVAQWESAETFASPPIR